MTTLPWRHVDREGDCWLWTSSTLKGYGKLAGTLAHRVFFRELIGPIPEGLELDHLCRTTLCVNPAHLEPVTAAENRRRKYAAWTHCKSGHLYDEVNTYVRPNGQRDCRACIRDRVRRYKQRRRRAA